MKKVDSRIDTLRRAIQEARRFIVSAEKACADLRTKDRLDSSKEYAAAKRASMDLANALVAVRSPKYP